MSMLVYKLIIGESAKLMEKRQLEKLVQFCFLYKFVEFTTEKNIW